MKFVARTVFAAVLLASAPLSAQSNGPAAACGASAAPNREVCLVAAQGLVSAHAQTAFSLTRGGPGLGILVRRGEHPDSVPRLQASVGLAGVFGALPPLFHGDPEFDRREGYVAPVVSASVAYTLFPGAGGTATSPGPGAVDVLGVLSFPVVSALGQGPFEGGTPGLAFAGGARVRLLAEGAAPGALLSVLYHRAGNTHVGQVCREFGEDEPGIFECIGGRSDVDARFETSVLSVRGTLHKRLANVELAGTAGYDRMGGEGAFRYNRRTELGFLEGQTVSDDVDLGQGRWSAAGSLSYVSPDPWFDAVFSLEAGWMQGAGAVSGYTTAAGDYDPGQGTLFVSLAAKLTP
jgi:hypothetical protein